MSDKKSLKILACDLNPETFGAKLGTIDFSKIPTPELQPISPEVEREVFKFYERLRVSKESVEHEEDLNNDTTDTATP